MSKDLQERAQTGKKENTKQCFSINLKATYKISTDLDKTRNSQNTKGGLHQEPFNCPLIPVAPSQLLLAFVQTTTIIELIQITSWLIGAL